MSLIYRRSGLTLRLNADNDTDMVRALQRDLRALGYLRAGIDGGFGPGTERAVRALQIDLLRDDAAASPKDGAPPITIATFNIGPNGKRVTAATGVLDEGLAACIDALLQHPDVPKLPESAEPRADNQRALEVIRNAASTDAPAPFIAAMVIQESGGQHFHVPGPRDADTFITVGLDRNDPADPDRITSRGYGIGQYTLFHHPPRADEVVAVMLDPSRNAAAAFRALREKFTKFVVGPADAAEDRKQEHPLLPLRECRYARTDSRFMRDCKVCAASVRRIAIQAGTPVFAGAQLAYRVDQYYPTADYSGVPDRAEFLCDWPYAVRRYNGSGVDSYHYQTHVLLNLLRI
jgi:hypothetical protein